MSEPSPPASALPRPPQVLEGFRVGALRRSAGALAVYSATDRLDLPVEMHLVRADAFRPPLSADTFISTLRRATEVRHESLLTYVTGGRAGDLLFAAAKTVDAPGLDEVIARGGMLAEERVFAIAQAVAAVLAALERAGLRHGDLTARRVLLPGRGQVAVAPPRLVPREIAPGNDRYLAPEEARGGAGDVRSDLFVLGLLLAEAATGGSFLKGSAGDVRRAIAAGQIPALPATVPAGPRALLSRLLAVDPAARFPTAAAAEAAIAQFALAESAPIPSAGSPADSRPETAPIPKSVVATARAAAAAHAVPQPGAPAPAAAPLAAGAPAAAVPASPAAPRPAGVPAADAPATRRSPGRLYLQSRLGETMLEVDEDVHVGWPAGAIDVAAQPDAFPDAEFVVERTDTADVLRAIATVRVNGKPATTQPLEHGDVLEGPRVRGRYERTTRTALKATGAGAPAGPPPDPLPSRLILVGALALAIAGVVVSVPRFSRARRAADEATTAALSAEAALRQAQSAGAETAPVGDPAVAVREHTAREAYDRAKDHLRKNPADLAGARERLLEVAERHAETGHGAIARAELAEMDRRARSAGDGELEKLLTNSKTDASEGRLDDAVNALKAFAEFNPGTVASERAAAAAVQLQGEIHGRFETDAARVERALAQKDWDAALRILARMGDYVPRSLKDRALEMRKRAEAGRDGVEVAPRPGEAPPAPKPPEPPKPPAGPGAGEGAGTPPPVADREKDADQAFRNAKKLMESGKDEEAVDALLAFLRDWKDTKVGKKYDVEARSRVTTLALGSAGITKLFRGKCEKAEKGRWRVSYDFSDPKQIEDFRDVETFEAPPRANWKVADGVARAKGSGALVLDATFAVDQLTVSAVVNPERAHDLGIAFLDAAEPRRHYLFILQNTFFTLGKGPDPKVFEENAIVLFGPGMWRDTPPGQNGFVRKNGSPEPAVRPGENTPLRVGKFEGQVWMRFEGGKQVNGSAYGDIKLEFQGIEPAVFVLNSAGTFDDFVVEGTPDPEWVATRWRAILSGL